MVYNDVASAAVTIPVTDAVPGLISSNSSGFGLGAVLNADQSVNSQGHPASPNDVVAIYGGGGGQTTTAGRMGGVTGVGASVAAFKLPVKVFLDGQQVTDVPYAGPAPDPRRRIFSGPISESRCRARVIRTSAGPGLKSAVTSHATRDYRRGELRYQTSSIRIEGRRRE